MITEGGLETRHNLIRYTDVISIRTYPGSSTCDVQTEISAFTRLDSDDVPDIEAIPPELVENMLRMPAGKTSSVTIPASTDGYPSLIRDICALCTNAYIDPFTRLVAELAYDDGHSSNAWGNEDLIKARRLLGNFRLGKGITSLRKALKVSPDAAGWELLGTALLLNGKQAEALEILDRNLGGSATLSEEAHFKLGLASYCAGDFRRASREFVTSKKDDSGAETLCGCAFLNCGQSDQASTHFSSAVEKSERTYIEECPPIPDCEACVLALDAFRGVDYAKAVRKKNIGNAIVGVTALAVLAYSFLADRSCWRERLVNLLMPVVLACWPGNRRKPRGEDDFEYCWMSSAWSKVKRDELRMGSVLAPREQTSPIRLSSEDL